MELQVRINACWRADHLLCEMELVAEYNAAFPEVDIEFVIDHDYFQGHATHSAGCAERHPAPPVKETKVKPDQRTRMFG